MRLQIISDIPLVHGKRTLLRPRVMTMSDFHFSIRPVTGGLVILLCSLMAGCAALPIGNSDSPVSQWKSQGAEDISDRNALDYFYDYLVRSGDGDLAHSFMMQTDPAFRARYLAERDAGIGSRDGNAIIQSLRARGYTGKRRSFYEIINLYAKVSAPYYNQAGGYFSFRKSLPHIVQQNENGQKAWADSGQRPPSGWPGAFKFLTRTNVEVRIFRDPQTAADIIARFRNPNFSMHTNFGLLYEIASCSRGSTTIDCEVRLTDQVVFADGRNVSRGTPAADPSDAVIFASQK